MTTKREARNMTDFMDLVTDYTKFPFVTVATSTYSVRMEIKPLSNDQCYMAIEVDVDGNLLMLINSTGTFDNLAYDTELLRSAIDDVVSGKIKRVETTVLGKIYKTVIALQDSGLTHTNTNAWLLPLRILAKPKTSMVQYKPYLT